MYVQYEMCSCTVSCSRDSEHWSTSSFRKLHMFVSTLFNTTVSLIILESAAVWHNLNSHSCGHLSALLFSSILLRLYFWLLDLFHFISYWVQMSACEHSYRRLINFLLLTYETCCLLSEVAFVQLYEFLWVTILGEIFLNICAVPCYAVCTVVLWHSVSIILAVAACTQLDFSYYW